MSEEQTERGVEKSLGPFRFKTPDWDCSESDCGNKADGAVQFEDRKISVCVDCAPQFLQFEECDWQPYAGGRDLTERDSE